MRSRHEIWRRGFADVVVTSFACAAFALGGCAYDWSLPSAATLAPTAPGEDDATAPDATAAARVEADAGAPDGALFADGAADAADDAREHDGGEDGGAVTRRACSPATPCPSGAFCDYPDNYCGAGLTGTCAPVPPSCSNPKIEATCGCNGTTYTSRCGANTASQDLSTLAPCPAPPNYRRCGYLFCGAGDYCLQQGGDYSCEPLSGCLLGCVCTGLLSACGSAGGACGSENGGTKVTCK